MVTHPLTYDPLVGRQPLPRVRLLSPLRTPPPGRALVLVPEAGPVLTVRPGEPVPDARYGVYQGMFTVDTTEHRLVLALRLAGRDASASFPCRVELMCQVTDPAAVVARGIRDMSATWYGPVHERLRKVSRTYDAGRFREAEEALNTALRDFTGDSAVRLHGARVELLAHSDPFDTPRRSRVRGTRRGGAEAATGPDAPQVLPAEAATRPDNPQVLLGEVLARKEEPLPPPHEPPRAPGPTPPPPTDPPSAPPPDPPPTPAPPPKRRPSRVRGTGTTGDGTRRDGTRRDGTTGDGQRDGSGGRVTGP
ncbi:hypothetical protein [Streptomyces albicerus]|uniref:hypothetical protein n=1 Tax=Streptomyces albicerus TaxID=2569859 RepID=UPI00124B8866|nr:hypothetical protein [Streptomyces albicerus]